MRGTFQFGLFAFDADRLELRRKGVLLRLQAQPAQLLACLVERAGQVVSREELRKAVWGDATFVDFEAGLNFCISQIRSILRDDSAQPLYIRTVPKSGYQFIAPVERLAPEVNGSRQTAATEAPAIDSPRRNVGEAGFRGAEQVNQGHSPARSKTWRWVAAGAVVTLAAMGSVALLIYLYLTPSGARNLPIVAVARFDNDTSDATINRFGDALTDEVVEELTARSGGNYRVIGNAQILRLPREQRDLRAIAASLKAGYIVLGQVQTNGEQLRILAHLIRLSDQTHIWVVRLDRARDDDLKLEADAAAEIALQFSSRMVQQPEKAGSFVSGTR